MKPSFSIPLLILIFLIFPVTSLWAQSDMANPEDVIINLQGTYGESEVSLDIDGKVNKARLDAFLEKYPNIKMRYGSIPLLIEGVGTESHLLLAIAGGTAPDMIEFNFRQSGTYVEKGFLFPLDEWINDQITAAEAKAQGIFDDNIMYKDELEKRVHPKAMDALYTKGPDGKKHYYFLPWKNEIRVMAYNKILFRQVGLDPDKDVPKTWDELWEIGKKLTNPDKDQHGFFGTSPDDRYLSWAAAPVFLSMNSTRVIRDPETGEWRAAFNGPGVAQAADFWLKLVSKEWIHPETGKTIRGIGKYGGDVDVWVQWFRDQVGLIFLGSNDILLNNNIWLQNRSYDQVGIAPIPAAPNGKSASELYISFAGITATVKDPAVRDAVWKFIRFRGSEEGIRIAVDTYVENNYGRFIMPELLEKYGYDEYVDEVPKEWVAAVKHSFANSYPEPYGKNTQHIYPMMTAPVSKALHEDLAQNPDEEFRLQRLQEYFDEAVIKTNEKMMEIVPENERRTREIVALVIASIIFILFILLFVYIWRVFTPKNLIIPADQSHFKKFKLAYILLTPAALGVIVFNYYPLVRGAMMAFENYNIIHGSEYIGLTNFALVFYDPEFWKSILIAGYYSLLYILMVFIPPIFLAILLTEIPVGKVFLRVVFYLPAVISGIVMMLMWKNFFNPTEEGLLNQMLGTLGIEPVWWLGQKSTAMISVMIPQAWAQLGPGCLIYLAALKTVPDDFYESVAIDGGGFLDRIRHVTLPIIKPLILIQLIFAVIGAFQASDAVLVMTAGGPDGATNVVGLEIFFNAYMFQRFGVATAMAWILGFILMGFTVFQMRRLSRLTFTTASSD